MSRGGIKLHTAGKGGPRGKEDQIRAHIPRSNAMLLKLLKGEGNAFEKSNVKEGFS